MSDHKAEKPLKTPAFAQGLSRREFMARTSALSFLATMGVSKPAWSNHSVFSAEKTEKTNAEKNSAQTIPQKNYQIEPFGHTQPRPQFRFNRVQADVIKTVQAILWPDDGDGPSADDLNAFAYLSWALADEQNQADGDPQFIVNGIDWLQDLANTRLNRDFLQLSPEQQQTLLEQISQSKAGKNWLALLLYYILEALTLDPFYSGVSEEDAYESWFWLEHQGGYPRPDSKSHYLHYRQH